MMSESSRERVVRFLRNLQIVVEQLKIRGEYFFTRASSHDTRNSSNFSNSISTKLVVRFFENVISQPTLIRHYIVKKCKTRIMKCILNTIKFSFVGNMFFIHISQFRKQYSLIIDFVELYLRDYISGIISTYNLCAKTNIKNICYLASAAPEYIQSLSESMKGI